MKSSVELYWSTNALTLAVTLLVSGPGATTVTANGPETVVTPLSVIDAPGIASATTFEGLDFTGPLSTQYWASSPPTAREPSSASELAEAVKALAVWPVVRLEKTRYCVPLCASVTAEAYTGAFESELIACTAASMVEPAAIVVEWPFENVIESSAAGGA